eukprot:4872311-Pleurochrysis_carterae.AAC.1
MNTYAINNVLNHLVAITFPAGSSGFDVRYSISAAEFPGTSGRNVLFTSYTQAMEGRSPCQPLAPPPLQTGSTAVLGSVVAFASSQARDDADDARPPNDAPLDISVRLTPSVNSLTMLHQAFSVFSFSSTLALPLVGKLGLRLVGLLGQLETITSRSASSLTLSRPWQAFPFAIMG